MLELKRELSRLSFEHWLNYEFLTWRWCLKLLIISASITIFIKYLDRKRALETVAYGLLVCLISLTFDDIGTAYALWEYPVRIVPFQFSTTHDFVVIPITYLLVYQRFEKWKQFLIANAIIAIIASLVMEPVFVALNYYIPLTWKHIYSLPIFFVIAIFSKLVIGKLKSTYKQGIPPYK